MFQLELISFGAPIIDALKAAGYEPLVVNDFDQVSELAHETGKTGSTPMMQIDRNDFVKGEAFWLFLRKDGRCVAGLAAKFFDLSNESLESYWRRTSKGQYQRAFDPITTVDPMVGLLRGRMVYVGELIVDEDYRGKTAVLTRFARLMQLLASNEWRFDWMFGFISEEHTVLNRLYGFSMLVRHAITWADPEPIGRLNTHSLVASSERQIRLLFTTDRAHKLGEYNGSNTVSLIEHAGSGA